MKTLEKCKKMKILGLCSKDIGLGLFLYAESIPVIDFMFKPLFKHVNA